MDQSPIAAVVAPEAKSLVSLVPQLTSSGLAGAQNAGGRIVKSTRLGAAGNPLTRGGKMAIRRIAVAAASAMLVATIVFAASKSID